METLLPNNMQQFSHGFNLLIEFTDNRDGTTTVVLTNGGLRDEEDRESHRDGWEASFDNLDTVLAL